MNATCINPNAGYGMWTVNDGNDTCKIHNLLYTYTPVLNHVYHITGPVYYAFGEFRIEPRSANDVVDVTGIDEIANNELKIYPNPVKNVLNVQTDDVISQVNIIDVTGRLVYSKQVEHVGPYSFDVSMLPEGVFSLVVTFNKQEKRIAKFIK